MTSTSRPTPGSSTNVRNLLRAELASSARRINHPHASYRSGKFLTCSICNLVIRSESLWEGHLRSANHRKNLHPPTSSTQEDARQKVEVGTKRKAELVESSDDDDEGEGDREGQELRTSGKKRKAPTDVDDDGDDTRKKTKNDKTVPRSLSFTEPLPEFVPAFAANKQIPTTLPPSSDAANPQKQDQPDTPGPGPMEPPINPPHPSPPENSIPQPSPIDESEWAAFEREIQPLTTLPLSNSLPTSTNATITAAPISASDLTLQAQAAAAAADKQSTKSRARAREEVAEGEREDEASRIADELEVQDEMERKVRRWRERREMLRVGKGDGDGGDGGMENVVVEGEESGARVMVVEKSGQAGDGRASDDEDDGDEDEDEDDGFDDWGLR